MTISKFTKTKSHNESIIERFEKLIKNSSKREIRKIEMALLKPQPIKRYTGKQPGISSFHKKTIEFTFSSEKYVEQIEKLIRINKHIRFNTHDTHIFEEFLDMISAEKLIIENGKLIMASNYILKSDGGKQTKITRRKK